MKEDHHDTGYGLRKRLVAFIAVVLALVLLAALIFNADDGEATAATVNNPPPKYLKSKVKQKVTPLGSGVITEIREVTEDESIEGQPVSADAYASGKRCWRFTQKKKFESWPFGTDLGKARISQYWCARGRVITNLPKATYSFWRTNAGALAGWQTIGVRNRERHWVRFWNRDHGAHLDKANVKFKQVIAGFDVGAAQLRMRALVRSNGTAN